jgi:hypothetical protein
MVLKLKHDLEKLDDEIRSLCIEERNAYTAKRVADDWTSDTLQYVEDLVVAEMTQTASKNSCRDKAKEKADLEREKGIVFYLISPLAVKLLMT